MHLLIHHLKRISIPRSVKKIEDRAFLFCEKLEKFEIPENSELQMIGNEAFFDTCLECILIPKNATDLKKRWSRRMKTNKFQISPENKNYFNYNDMFILGKINQKSDIFDFLIYARNDIKIAVIPSFIKIIGRSAFENCKDLTRVDIQNDSCLQKIGKQAFFCTKIKQIFIPSHVKKISSRVFGCCLQLSKIEFADNSELQIIGNYAFNGCNLDYLTIPNNVVELKKNWSLGLKSNQFKISSECKNFKIYNGIFILGKSDINIQNFDVIVYCYQDVERVFIPSFVKIISNYSFYQCKNLKIVDFQKNSNIEIIEKGSFCDLKKLEKITIPSHVKSIRKNAFSRCFKLNHINIEDNSKLLYIGNRAFQFTPIKSFSIPSCVSKIFDDVFNGCNKIQIIEVGHDFYLITLVNLFATNSNILIMVSFKKKWWETKV